MIVQRVEKHIIKPSDTCCAMLDYFCFLFKNLYNYANYILRQAFINSNKAVLFSVYKRLGKEQGQIYREAKASKV